MAIALSELHAAKIVHRDVKAANVLISKTKLDIKIADMNVSKVAKNKFLYT